MPTWRRDNYRLVVKKHGAMKVDATVYCSPDMDIEPDALKQLEHVAAIPSIEVALATPDIHVGYGAPIGTVAALKDFVCPAAVGYDINCGMRLLSTPLVAVHTPVQRIADAISRVIPLGEGKSGSVELASGQFRHILENGVRGLFDIAQGLGGVMAGWDRSQFDADIAAIEDHGSMQASSAKLSERSVTRGISQLGTLGGGNHFIELQEVVETPNEKAAAAFGLRVGALAVMVHSGSRGFGHQVGGEFMQLAREISHDFAPSPQLGLLALSSKKADEYIDAMRCAANFAYCNRQVMVNAIRSVFARELGASSAIRTVYDVTHNMAKKETHGKHKLWVHRKGATRAFPPSLMAHEPYSIWGQPVLIPGSMGTPSYVLVAGPKAEESLFSVNHGAGRVMSRTAALGKKGKGGKPKGGAISDEEFRDSMQGIHLICADRRSIKEEAPSAYKDISTVIGAVTGAGLARVVAKMVPLAVLKG